MWLFVATMAVLLAPKLFGYILLCKDRQLARRYGGVLRVALSLLFETVLSALVAPVMMVMQSTVVAGILTGHAVGWTTQRRHDGSIPWRAVARRHVGHSVIGVILAVAAYAVSPSFLAWMSPIVIGLVLAIPVSAATAQQGLGRMARRLGLLVTPEETEPPQVLQRVNELTRELTALGPRGGDALEWVACNSELRDLHAAMLPATPAQPKGEYDVDLWLGLAKLHDADNLAEASALLSSSEKLAVLNNRTGIERLSQLGSDNTHPHG
jgi:membrane glycosyltransferase